MVSFDFQNYLLKIHPNHRYDIQTLAGGLVNFTVRARRQAAAKDTASQADDLPPSIILKQAPPYIAVLGDKAPFTQQRQVGVFSSLRGGREFLTLMPKCSWLRPLSSDSSTKEGRWHIS